MLTDLCSYHTGPPRVRYNTGASSSATVLNCSVDAVSFKLSRIVVAARNFSVVLRQLRETRGTGKHGSESFNVLYLCGTKAF